RDRAAEALARREEAGGDEPERPWRTVVAGATPGAGDEAGAGARGVEEATSPDEPVALALAEGTTVKDLAKAALRVAGFRDVTESKRAVAGVQTAFVATDAAGATCRFELAGHLTKGSDRAGLRATDTVLRAVGKGAALAAA